MQRQIPKCRELKIILAEQQDAISKSVMNNRIIMEQLVFKHVIVDSSICIAKGESVC